MSISEVQNSYGGDVFMHFNQSYFCTAFIPARLCFQNPLLVTQNEKDH